MCCRYYYDDKMAKEIEKICMKIDRKLKLASGEYRPSQKAPVITGRTEKNAVEEMKWGFPQHEGKGLLINARCESMKERYKREQARATKRILVSGVRKSSVKSGAFFSLMIAYVW